ncbi:MAG: hypothetical protein AAF612_06670 [Planctomycetota bacterium]
MSKPNLVRPWELLANPILRRGVRARLRPRTAIGLGSVVLIIAVFLTALPIVRAQNLYVPDPQAGAGVALVLLLGFQGVILLLGGTGAAASGMARERADNVLDYQRMTPMPTASKIVGMLYGLPAREYAMAALVLPLALYAALEAGVNLFDLLRFYGVMLLSVAAYHMTGMTAGIIAKRPWRANMLAQGLIVVLYLVLPQLSQIQLDAFQYLTVLPAARELLASQDIVFDGERFTAPGDVPLFTAEINPTLFSVIMLGFVLTCLSHVVARRFRDDSANLFAKPFAYAFVTAACALATGAFWPLVEDPWRFLDRESFRGPGVQELAIMMLSLHLGLCLAAALVAILASAPDRFATIRGDRRRLKLGLPGIGWRRDEATVLPLAAWSAAVIAVSYLVLIGLLRGRPDVLDPAPGWAMAVPPLAYVLLVIAFVALARELAGARGVLFVLFMAWIVPTLIAIILGGAADRTIEALYVLAPMPVFGILLEVSNMLENTIRMDGGLAGDIGEHATGIRAFGLACYAISAAGLAPLWVRRRRALFRLAQASMQPGDLPAKAESHQAQNVDQPGPAQG